MREAFGTECLWEVIHACCYDMKEHCRRYAPTEADLFVDVVGLLRQLRHMCIQGCYERADRMWSDLYSHYQEQCPEAGDAEYRYMADMVMALSAAVIRCDANGDGLLLCERMVRVCMGRDPEGFERTVMPVMERMGSHDRRLKEWVDGSLHQVDGMDDRLLQMLQPVPKPKRTVEPRKPAFTLCYNYNGTDRPQRLHKVYRMLCHFGWIEEVDGFEVFENFFSGRVLSGELRWTGKQHVLYHLLKKLDDSPFFDHQPGVSALQVARSVLGVDNVGRKAVNTKEEAIIWMVADMLDPAKSLAMGLGNNTGADDIDAMFDNWQKSVPLDSYIQNKAQGMSIFKVETKKTETCRGKKKGTPSGAGSAE